MSIKNSIMVAVVKKIVNKKIEEYGTVVNLQINTMNKNILLEALLKGEKENITIRLEGYEIIHNPEGSVIKFKNVSASREWIDVFLLKYDYTK